MKNCAVCIQIDMEYFEWGLSVRLVDLYAGQMHPSAENGNMGNCRLCSILNVLLFLEVNFAKIKASMKLFAYCCFYITFS